MSNLLDSSLDDLIKADRSTGGGGKGGGEGEGDVAVFNRTLALGEHPSVDEDEERFPPNQTTKRSAKAQAESDP